MANIGIVTDSSSDIPGEIAEKYGIEIIPMYAGFDGKLYRDQLEIQPEEIYKALKEGKKVTTAAPSAGDYSKVFNYLLDEKKKDFIYCLTLSSKLSGAYNSANASINSFFKSSNNIRVIDTKTSTICMGFIVMQAAKAANAGWSPDKVEQLISELIERNKFIAVLESFEYVFKGGRAAFVGKILTKAMRFTPVLTIGKRGKVHLTKFTRNKESALKEIYRKSIMAASLNDTNKIGVFYGSDIGPAKELEKLILQNKDISVEEILVTKITTVISAHTGPGIWGVAVSPKLI